MDAVCKGLFLIKITHAILSHTSSNNNFINESYKKPTVKTGFMQRLQYSL